MCGQCLRQCPTGQPHRSVNRIGLSQGELRRRLQFMRRGQQLRCSPHRFAVRKCRNARLRNHVRSNNSNVRPFRNEVLQPHVPRLLSTAQSRRNAKRLLSARQPLFAQQRLSPDPLQRRSAGLRHHAKQRRSIRQLRNARPLLNIRHLRRARKRSRNLTAYENAGCWRSF